MKRLILVLLIIPSLLFAGSLQQKHKSVIARLNVAGGEAACDTILYENVLGSGNERVYGTVVQGQGIAASAGDNICSVSLYLDDVLSTQTITARIGTSENLTSYSQTVDVVVTSADNDTFVVFAFPSDVTGSTLYYVGFMTGASAYGDGFDCVKPYELSITPTRYESNDGWDMTGDEEIHDQLKHKVYER